MMSNDKKTTNEKWKGMRPKEFFDHLPKETLGMKLRRLYMKLKREDSSHTISGYRGNVGANIPRDRATSSTSQFKENYRVNPPPVHPTTVTASDVERESLRQAAVDAYLDSLPGFED